MQFEEYVAARGQALLRLAFVLTADDHEARDVVQSALADAYRHWRKVSRAGDPDAYVRRIVVGLAPRARSVLVLRYYLDLDDVAIAELLGVTPSSVRATASRALALLPQQRLGPPVETTMTDQAERCLRDTFMAEAERAPAPGNLAAAARRQVRLQRRRLAAVVGAGLGVLALTAGIVTALGLGSSSQQAREPAPTPSSTPFSEPAELFFSNVEHTEALLDSTPENLARLEVRWQRAYADCMRTSGFDYHRPAPARRQPTFYAPSWWARPSLADARRGLGYAVQPAPDAGTPQLTDASTDTHSYDGALAVCRQAVDFRPEFSDPPNPAARSLLRSLTITLNAAATSSSFKPIQRRYADCMTSRGIAVREPGGIYDIAEEKVFSRINNFNPDSKEYRAALPGAKAVEVAIGTADVMCRAPLADDIARSLSPVWGDWSARNGRRVSEAAKGW